MAKRDKQSLDDFDFDGSFDYDFDDMGSNKVQSKSAKARQVVLETSKGVVAGAASNIASKSMLKRVISKSLPKEYSSTFNLADDSIGDLKDLYNSAGKEIKPVIDSTKRLTRQVMPRIRNKLPKKVADMFDNWSKLEGGDSVQSGREQELTRELEFFKLSTENEHKNRQEDKVQQAAKDEIENLRHANILSHLREIARNSVKSTAYRENITLKYQKKSLELQHRSYFAQLDALQELKTFASKASEELQAIRINSALPEIQKITKAESAKELLRNKFLGGAYDTINKRTAAFRQKFFENINKRVIGSMREFKDGFSSHSYGAGEIMSGMDMTEGMEATDKARLGGEMGGGLLSDLFISDKFLGNLGKKLGRSKYGNSIRRGNAKLSVFNDNWQSRVKDWSRTSDGESGILGGLVRMLKESVPSLNPDWSMQTNRLKDLNKPAVFTNVFTRSVTEVIPGYLAMIARELQILRTGNESISTVRYDFDKSEFKSEKSLRKELFESVVQKSNYGQSEMEALFKKIDPEGKIDESTRKQLLSEFVKQNFRGGSSDIGMMLNRGGSSEAFRKVAPQFESYFGKSTDSKKLTTTELERRAEFSRAFKQSGESIQPNLELIQDLINSGQISELKAIGLVDNSGNFNSQLYLDYALGNKEFSIGDDVLAKGSRNFKVRNVNVNNNTNSYSYGNFGGTARPRETGRVEDTSFTTIDQEEQKQFRDKTTEQLAEIIKYLERGITVAGFGASPGTPGADDPKKRWYQFSVGEALGIVTTTGKNAVRGAYNFASGIANKLTGAGKFIGGKIMNTATTLGSWGIDKLTGLNPLATDIYIKGERYARLRYQKLKDGQYIDSETKKPITSWKDLLNLKGNVVDTETGQVVFNKEELANISEKMAGRARALLSTLVKKGQQLRKFAIDLSGSAYKAMFTGARSAMRMSGKAVSLLRADDVYVAGETTPRLLATIMRAGGYALALDPKKIIWYPSQINGSVISLANGEVLLTDSDIAKGLVDKQGKPFVSLRRRLLNGLKSSVGFLKKTAISGLNMLRGGLSKAWTNVKKFFNGFGIAIVAGSDIVAVLNKIYNLLDHRMPGKRKKVYGEANDDDGLRSNSWQDKAKQRAAGLADGVSNKAGELKEKIKQSSMFGAMASMFGNLFSKKKKDDQEEDEEDEDSGWGDWLGMGADGALLSDGVAGIFGKTKWGRRFKAGRLKKKRAKARAKPKTGKPGMFTRMKNWVKPGTTATAGAGTTAAASGALGGGVVSTGGRVLKSGLKLGSKAPLLGSLLGAGLLANNWADKDTSTRDKVGESGDIVGGILGGLAAGAAAGAVFGGVGAIPGALIGGLVGAFAGKKVANYGYDKFASKASNKTKPQPGSISRLKLMQYGFDGESVNAASAIGWLETLSSSRVRKDGDSYTIDLASMNMAEVYPSFGIDVSNTSHVKNFAIWLAKRFIPVYTAYHKAINDSDLKCGVGNIQTQSTKDQLKIITATVIPGDVYSSKVSPFPGLKINTTSSMVDAEKKLVLDNLEKQVKSSAGGSLAAIDKTTNSVAASKDKEKSDLDKSISDLAGELNGKAGNMVGGTLASTTVKLISAGRGYGRENDELDYVRWKAYGLTSLEESKVRTLVILEEVTKKNIKFDTDSNATWTGNIRELVEKVGPLFGISGLASDQASRFIRWFNSRFLPIYLNYAGEIKRITGDTDPLKGANKLKNEQKAPIALILKGVQSSKFGFSRSVWNMSDSPWENYELNSDDKSVDSNIKSLTETKSPKLVANEKHDPNKPATLNNLPFRVEQPKNKLTSDYVAKQTTSYASNTAGQATYAVNEGTGGKVDQLPAPAGAGGYAAVKDMIDAAAKMAGVDPNLLAIIAGIESNFKPGAQAAQNGSTKTSAGGLFQFIDSTWKSALAKYGKKYGLGPDTSKFDPRANTLMGAELLKENANALKSVIKRDPTAADLYAAHFMGSSNAGKFLTSDPNAIAASLLPGAAASNRSIFYKSDGTAKTIAEVYDYMKTRISSVARSYKIGDASTASTGRTSIDLPTRDGVNNVAQPSSLTGITPGGAKPIVTPSKNVTGIIPDIPTKSNESTPQPVAKPAQDAARNLREVSIPTRSSNMVQTKAIVDTNREIASNEARAVYDVMNKQLAVQIDTYSVIKQIYATISNTSGNTSSDNSPGAKQVPPASTVPKQLVSMRRNNYS